MLIVADSSALIALSACGELDLLAELFDDVRVPVAVLNEVSVPGKPEAEELKAWLGERVVNVPSGEIIEGSASLGRGELEAMHLFRRLGADFLLVDDALARKVAKSNSIAVIGSVGVLLAAKSNGLLPAIRPAVDALRSSEVFVAEALLRHALSLAGEL